MTLPKQYNFLNDIADLPRIVKIALDHLGTKEVVGIGSNATILSWAKELGIEKTYNDDSIAWCGLFIAMVVKRSGRDPVANPLWARNWQTFGAKAQNAMLGDILVFVRNGGGHVAIYIGEDKEYYHVIGGNQSDSVNITRISKERCVAIRRPIYKQQPLSVKRYFVSPNGLISTNEA